MSTEELAIMNTKTGELMKPEGKSDVSPYEGASMRSVSNDQAAILLKPLDASEIEIKPDGSPYFPQSKYRRKLNESFGPMGWALIPRGELSLKNNIMYRTYALFVGGRFVAEATGDQAYHENNANMTYADAAEGAKSNALERCCKDLGIASELWDPAYIAIFKRDFCVQVWVRNRSGQAKKQWRRKDREPFEGEGPIGEQPEQPQTISNSSSTPVDQSPANPNVVTAKQATALYAIAMNANYTKEQYHKVITSCGYTSDREIKISHYPTIRQFIEGTPVDMLERNMSQLVKWCKEN
jgi:hypothetical protein